MSSLHSSGEIDVRAVLVTVVEANVIIALAAESTASAEVEALALSIFQPLVAPAFAAYD